MEISEGKQTTKTYSNGQYRMANALNPLDVFFVDRSYTTVVENDLTRKYDLLNKLHYCDSIEYTEDKKEKTEMDNGLNKITYNGVRFATIPCPDGYEMQMLSVKTVQSIQYINVSATEIPYAKINANYFDLKTGAHYGVEQSDEFDDAPKNPKYMAAAQLNSGEVVSCNASDYWYSKAEVKFGMTPYAVTMRGGQRVNERSTAYGNKDAVLNTQTCVWWDGKRWYFTVTDASQKTTPAVITEFARAYGAVDCFILDSGGSTQMMLGSTKVVSGDNRKLPNILAFVKIKEAPKPTEPEVKPEEPVTKECECDNLRAKVAELEHELDKLNASYNETIKKNNELTAVVTSQEEVINKLEAKISAALMALK